MSKNYLPDIVVIRKPFAFIKKMCAIILVIGIVVGTFILADICSGALNVSAIGLNISNNDRINVDRYSLYAISMGAYEDKASAEKVALGLQVQGGAGYVWQSNNKHLVLGSIYAKKEEADSVLDSLSKTNYQAQLFEIKFAKLSLVIKGLEKQDNAFIKNLFLCLDKMYADIYTYSINYDSNASTNLAISAGLNTLKGEVKIYISKLQELSTRVNSNYVDIMKDSFILLDSVLDTAVYRTLTDSGINYYLKYLMCEVVDISYKLNQNLYQAK